MATSKAMWEVDPETRSKLLAIGKEGKNNICCDCGAPSPQWASPKFGVFICLSCAGVHRGLGVHISFVRSVSMDAFKPTEIERMRLGGNEGWRKFFEEHEDTVMMGLSWDEATIAERYSGSVGEEWKERLTCKVEGKEYVASAAAAGEKKKKTAATGTARPAVQVRSSTPLSGRRETATPPISAAAQGQAGGKIKVDDKYFARLGADNANRSEHLPPSQGGKYAGFGNTPGPAAGRGNGDAGAPSLDELQKDPLAALTKGFGWFASTVTKTAKDVNEGYIQPTAQKIAESDIAKQAQLTAAQVARQAQQGARTANEGFMRFVEGDGPGGQAHSGRYRAAPLDESRKDFWDDFASLADQRQGSSSIGTAAMGMGAGARGGGPAKKKKEDDWDDW